MSKKKMRKTYLPARIVKAKNQHGNDKWYIKYYQVDPSDGVRKMHRSTHELNRIIDLSEREEMARKICEKINRKLPFGYPYQKIKPSKKTKLKVINIVDGVQKALNIKSKSTSHRTHLSHKSVTNIFITFLKFSELDKLYLYDFSKVHVMEYIDYLKEERGVSGVTINNNISVMKAMFNELLVRGYLKKNRFSKVKKERTSGKKRRAFTEKERIIIINHLNEIAKEKNVKSRKIRLLLLAIKLQYHCFIRPTELLRLRFLNFDLGVGVIKISSDINKNNRNEMVTIPDHLIEYLKDFGIDSHQSQNDFVFGNNGKPHATITAGKGMLGTWMRNELKHLYKTGKLHSIKGLSLYSWKDTGIMELFKAGINILEIMKQARHKDLKTTQRYCQSLYYINRQIKALNNPI